jgi:hypothetical protein
VPLRRQHPVLAGAWPGTLVGAAYGVGVVVALQLGHAGAEGDEHALFFLEKEAFGQLALQALHGLDAFGQLGVGQDQHELLAAIARQLILGAHDLACDQHQMLQRRPRPRGPAGR